MSGIRLDYIKGHCMKLPQILTIILLAVNVPAWASVKSYFNNNLSLQYREPYRNITRPGDNLEQIILNEISKAKKSIYLAVQELRLPLVAKALIEKKNQGVDVRVILEHDYNFTVLSQRDAKDDEYEATKLRELWAFIDVNRDGKISKAELAERDAIYMLQAAKVPMMDDTFDNSRGSGLMHHKFMVVDGKSTIVSTANFTMSCIHGDMLSPASRGNANSMVQVESTAFAKVFTEEFSQMWGNGKRGNFGHNKTYRGPQVVTVRGIRITIQFSPTSARYNWEESTNGLIALHLAQARRSVQSALFVFSDQKISNVLQKRHDAGVKMGFIIEPKFAFRDYSELLDMLGASMLNQKCVYQPDNNPWKNPLKEGGMPLLPRGDVLHHKFAVVDNEKVIMGSQNLSASANYINDETAIVIEHKGIAESFTREYARLKRSSSFGIPYRVVEQIRAIEAHCADTGLYF